MNRFRKWLSVALVTVLVCLLCAGILPASAAEYILDPSQARGSDYTPSDQLASALDQVFSGDVDVYSDSGCTVEVSMPLGTSMSNSTQYYVKSKTTGNKISGWQCYIYANGVYNQLFREWVGHANGFAHSETVISGGGNTLSYEILTNAGVRCGAYLRTTGNSDGSYSSNVGHSMIFLAYDETSITYLEGNADGNGLIRVTTRTWSDFNQRQLSGRSRYIAHIVQPKAEVYEQLYPVCAHEQYDGLGICGGCGQAFDWEGTFLPGAAGNYQVKAQVTSRLTAPYDGATPGVKLEQGQTLEIFGAYENAFGELWYAYAGSDGNRHFVQAQYLEFSQPLTLQVVCSDFSPVNHALLERKSQPVKGTVTSNCPIRTITAYLDGEQYATWTAGDQQTMTVDLRATDVNYLLKFTALEKGAHTIVLKLQSFLYEDMITIHESVFYMEEITTCEHRYQWEQTQAPTCTREGVGTYTCELCLESYTEVIGVIAHRYEDGSCVLCGAGERVTLTGTVTSSFGEGIAMEVILYQDGTALTRTTVTGLEGSYTFTDIPAGGYTLELRKTGGVTRSISLNLTAGVVTQDAQIFQLGDVNGDGRLSVGDTARLYGHIRGANPITDPYTLQCGDMNQDGSISVGDVSKIYARIKGTI